jgi:hypothetical protein
VKHCRLPPPAPLVVEPELPEFPLLPELPLLPEPLFEQKYVFLPVSMMLPSEELKFDFPDCWAMVTVLPSDEV